MEMSSAFMAQLPFIGSSATLGWQRDDVALSYMEHILQRARVLLPRRGWRVGLIKEFYPRGASLQGLNVNAGSEVCIRFRVPGKKNEFLPFHEVLCTALHEFTHCVHSRHDRTFWNLYYDLVKECEALEVTMIQQGLQLYPELSYSPVSSLATAPQQSRSTRRDRAAAKPSGSRGGGRRWGAGGAVGNVTGRGEGVSTCGRNATQTITNAGLTPPSRNSSAAKGEAFPGEGRRLGGVGLRQYSVEINFTPTRDALRRILADAAERRLMRKPPPAGTTQLDSDTLTQPRDDDAYSRQDEGQTEVDDDGLPDCVPQSLFDEQDGGGWKCLRCGFLNDDGVFDSCAFCADCDEGDEAEAVWLKRPRLEGDHPQLEMPKRMFSSTIASKTVPTQLSPQQQCESRLNKKYIIVSDNDGEDY